MTRKLPQLSTATSLGYFKHPAIETRNEGWPKQPSKTHGKTHPSLLLQTQLWMVQCFEAHVVKSPCCTAGNYLYHDVPWSNILGWSSRSFTSLGGSKTKVSCRSRAFRSAFVLVVVVVIVVVVVVVLFLLVLLLLLLVVKSGLGTGATLPFASWPASLLCCCQLADVEAVYS